MMARGIPLSAEHCVAIHLLVAQKKSHRQIARFLGLPVKAISNIAYRIGAFLRGPKGTPGAKCTHCDRSPTARGLCRPHYNQLLRGRPLGPIENSKRRCCECDLTRRPGLLKDEDGDFVCGPCREALSTPARRVA